MYRICGDIFLLAAHCQCLEFTSDKNSVLDVLKPSEPSPKHRMCVVSASNPNMGAYKPILITAGAENYSLVAIQRPCYVTKSTTCAREARVAAPKVPDSAVVASNALNPRIWAPWNTSKGVGVLGFGASRLYGKKPLGL